MVESIEQCMGLVMIGDDWLVVGWVNRAMNGLVMFR